MKKLAIVALLVFVVASMAFSQAKPGGIARQAAMGGSQAGTSLILNPFIIDDPAFVLVNPAYQSWYHDYAWSNIGGGAVTGTDPNGYNFQNAGVGISLNDSWNLGMTLSYDPSAVNLVSPLLSLSGLEQRPFRAIPAVANVWEVVASTKSGSSDWGFGVMYGWSSNNATSSTTTPSTSSDAAAKAWMLGLRAGTIMDLGSGSLFDGSVSFRMDKASDNITTNAGSGGEYSASGSEFGVNLRARFKQSAKFNFVPYGTLTILSAEPKEDTPPAGVTAQTATFKASGLLYGLGLGGELHTNTFYMAGGLSFQSAQLKLETNPGGAGGTTSTFTTKYTAIPVFNLGGEWQFTDWLAGRAGYFRYIGSISYKAETSNGTSETSGSGSPNPPPGVFLPLPFPGVHSSSTVGALGGGNWDGVVTLGVGLKFGAWAMDATVSDEALRRGLGLVGTSNMNTFGYVTASYNFAE